MENRKKVCVHFVHEENVNHMILPLDQVKKRGRKVAEKVNDIEEKLPTEIASNGSEIRSTLLCNDTDVAGRELFSMDRSSGSLHKRKVASLETKSSEISSPRTPSSSKKTPKKTPNCKTVTPKSKTFTPNCKTPQRSEGKHAHDKSVTDLAKTPYSTRNRFKQELAKRAKAVVKGDNSESDFSPSNSEDESDEDESDSKENSESEEEARSVTPLKPIHMPNRRISLRQKERNHDDLKYVFDADEYFRQGKSKSRTSNHTLGRLKTPRLPPDELRTLLEKTKQTHEKPIRSLLEEQQRTFAKWIFILNEGYSVLAYGVGSKRNLLNSFYRVAVNFPVLVCNGYFPSLTINQILDSITTGILGAKESLVLSESIELVERSFRAGSKHRMVLVIHNIEGPCLRSSKIQEVLARIARLRNVWLIASVDHINGPIIWDQTMMSNFNFSLWDATSFLPYTEETSYESSLMIQRTGTLMLSSLTNVFKSLTSNAQGIFMVIAEYQLARCKTKGVYQGMQFKDLYRSCRDKMLVSSDQTLRAQLTEFLDHKLIVSKRGQGGSEVLNVPLESGLLETFLEQRNEM